MGDIWNQKLQAQLRLELDKLGDVTLLRRAAERYYPEPNVSIPIFERIVMLVPHDVAAMTRIAEMYAMHDKKDSARQWAERALAIDPKFVDALYAISQTYTGEHREAVADRILLVNPHHFGAIREKAHGLMRRSRRDEAERLVVEYLYWLQAQTANVDERLTRPARALLDDIQAA